ncbi:ATP-dependent nuclease [Nocardia takedensis]|uniref:ATP-dependent nuclease n=1 Tax=Nocardia takedensis TaxID=259390 RepID=UPI003F77428A
MNCRDFGEKALTAVVAQDINQRSFQRPVEKGVCRVRLRRLLLDGHRSVETIEFEASSFTVLFGKNNAGKTSILETLFGILEPNAERRFRDSPSGRGSTPSGAVVVQLESGLPFDKEASLAAFGDAGSSDMSEVAFTKSRKQLDEFLRDEIYEWRGQVVDAPRPHVLFLDWSFSDIHGRVESAIEKLAVTEAQRRRNDSPWLESTPMTDRGFAYRIPPTTEARVEQLSQLSSDLLPDFVDGKIRAHVTVPSLWQRMPKVLLEYDQRGLTQCADTIDEAGSGAARWMAVAIQIALHLMEQHPDVKSLSALGDRGLSGKILLVDEPEAHLHPAAVQSMVAWCQRMVHHGAVVIVASHHEQFLRAAGNGITLVHVTRDADLVTTSARTLPTAATTRLQDLARDIGMHPASILSLHKAILFVEGPLDEAVLDEYAGIELEAAGIKILPIHGTKNLEGLVDSEIVTELGIKIGILTDATDPLTMASRSGRKRSSEERKLIKILEIAARKKLPAPEVFGVTEADLLFALPPKAVKDFYSPDFPGWEELVAECRQSLGKGPSDSVNWKKFAYDRYNLPIETPSGVRSVVRKLDVSDIPLPSIRAVIDEIVGWAREER